MRPNESFIGQPVRSLQTMLRVIAEDDPSLPSVIPDGIYGNNTMIAVTAFQRRAGIPVTGITDENTWRHIVNAYEPALIRIEKAEAIEVLLEPGQIIGPGEQNAYVGLTKAMLAQLSKDHQSIGYHGISQELDPDTSDALRAFQQLAGLEETGALDRITWRHLVRQFTLNASQEANRQR